MVIEKRSKVRVETEYIKIWKEEGIIHCVFSDKLEMDLAIAQHCVKERIAFSEGVSYPCLINMKGLRSVTKEARAYMGVEGAQFIKAGALLVNSALTQLIGNTFLAINKPKVPTKIFSDYVDALTWLKTYL